jgi:hypothetical protein
MAILAQETCGPSLLKGILFGAQFDRRNKGASQPRELLEIDVHTVITDIYEAASAIVSDWAENEDDDIRAARGAKKARYEENKRKEDHARDATDAADDMDEDAAEASGKGKGKGKATDVVKGLAGKMGKTAINDNTMPESDSDDDDEDPVRPSGWVRAG